MHFNLINRSKPVEAVSGNSKVFSKGPTNSVAETSAPRSEVKTCMCIKPFFRFMQECLP